MYVWKPVILPNLSTMRVIVILFLRSLILIGKKIFKARTEKGNMSSFFYYA